MLVKESAVSSGTAQKLILLFLMHRAAETGSSGACESLEDGQVPSTLGCATALLAPIDAHFLCGGESSAFVRCSAADDALSLISSQLCTTARQ